MLNVTIGPSPASYSTADGWRCNDGLAQRHLQALSSPDDKPISEEQALALAIREYGEDKVAVVTEDERDAIIAISSTAPAEPMMGTLSDLELPPPDTTLNERVLGFLGARGSSR